MQSYLIKSEINLKPDIIKNQVNNRNCDKSSQEGKRSKDWIGQAKVCDGSETWEECWTMDRSCT